MSRDSLNDAITPKENNANKIKQEIIKIFSKIGLTKIKRELTKIITNNIGCRIIPNGLILSPLNAVFNFFPNLK